MKDYKNIETNKKNTAQVNRVPDNSVRKADRDYSYYSRVLQKPFDSIGELKEAEAAYFAEQKAKEDKAAAKKADANLVEEAFKALNTTRRTYKEALTNLTVKYSEDLKNLKEAFEADKKELQDILAQAEEAYSIALKAFTEKYPEGYHLTLKDGDFETTISGNHTANLDKSTPKLFDFFDLMFNF